MRGNAWQITAIISIILVVLLIIPLVIMGRNHQTLDEQAKQAKAEQTAAAQRAATLEREVAALNDLIGRPGDAVLTAQQEHFADLAGKVLPGEDGPTYHDLVVDLLGDLVRSRDETRVASERLAQLQSDFNAARDRHEAVAAQIRNDLRRVEGERDTDRAQAAIQKAALDRQLQEGQRQQAMTLGQLEQTRHQLTDRLRVVTNDNLDIRESNQYLTELLADVRNPNVEHPAGKIISVDQKAGTAIINIGNLDGLRVRTMFSVYHAGITGLTFHTAPVGRESVYCDVCMRDVARDVSKASVEVMQILGPHQALVRILDDILTDPIMVGDVVYSPIWKPGQRLRFALTSGMHLPGAGIDAGTEAVKRLIEMNGGEVDCWIDELAEGGDYLQGSLSDLTNFIVINEKAPRSADPEVARIHQALVESAKNRAVKAISLEELLSRMAWRNMTPVDRFDSLDFLPEMRAVPLHQGTVQRSTGVVSPIFTPDNPESRLNAREATPVRTSPGVVSPYFDSNAPTPPSSSGRTSDLFRPRSPN